MRTIKSIALCTFVFVQTVKSQNNNHKYYIEGQFCGGIHQKAPAAGLGGAFGFYISPNQSVDLRAREIYNFPNKIVIGAISVNYRYHFKNGFFIGGGFGHHHELSEEHYKEHPAEASMGTEHNIMHRSGLAAEMGYNFKPIAKEGFLNRVYPCTNIIATYMLKDKGLNPLITINAGLRIGLQKY